MMDVLVFQLIRYADELVGSKTFLVPRGEEVVEACEADFEGF